MTSRIAKSFMINDNSKCINSKLWTEPLNLGEKVCVQPIRQIIWINFLKTKCDIYFQHQNISLGKSQKKNAIPFYFCKAKQSEEKSLLSLLVSRNLALNLLFLEWKLLCWGKSLRDFVVRPRKYAPPVAPFLFHF